MARQPVGWRHQSGGVYGWPLLYGRGLGGTGVLLNLPNYQLVPHVLAPAAAPGPFQLSESSSARTRCGSQTTASGSGGRNGGGRQSERTEPPTAGENTGLAAPVGTAQNC